jgi:hypothetical protein
VNGAEADAARYPADQVQVTRSGRLAGLRRFAASDAVLAVAACGLSGFLAAVVLRIWRADLNVPFAYMWDANQYAMYIKEILDHGWYYRNDNLGAPFGQQLYDYPNVSTDNLQAALIKLLGVFSSDWATVMNVYFLLTFPLVAVAAYLCFRRLGATAAPSVVCATLFALLPYHFARGEHHLFYSGYFAVPIGAYLALSVFAGKPLFARRDDRWGRTRLGYASHRSLLTVGLCAVVATASGAGYYALFTMLLVAAGMVVSLVTGGGRGPLISGGVVIALIGGVLVVNLSPSLVYRAKHGANPIAGHRSWTESEFQALKLTQLVLPIEDHRIGALARASGKYAEFQRSLGAPEEAPELERPAEAEAVHLGLVGSLGFVFLLVTAVAAAVGARSRPFLAYYREAAAAGLVAFLIGTVGGISALIAAGITPQFRSWNRISIFIAFFALLAVALSLSALQRRWRTTRGGQIALAATLALVLGVGVLDQTSAADVPPYRSIAESYGSDAAFVRSIERRLGGDGSVYQLPYVPFPDGGLFHRLTEYDLVRGYFHSDRLRWSFGAMSGRPEDWQAELAKHPLTLQLPGVAAVGFAGIYVDRRGYSDSGRSIERELTALAGGPPLESRDRQLMFFDIRRARQDLASRFAASQLRGLREAVLRPIRLEWPAGGELEWDDQHAWHATGAEAELVVVNPSGRPLRTRLEAVLATRRNASGAAIVRYPDGTSARVTASSSGTKVGRIFELPPGRSIIRVTAPSPPLWAAASIVDERLWPFESARAAFS